jgi:hypothetical protein
LKAGASGQEIQAVTMVKFAYQHSAGLAEAIKRAPNIARPSDDINPLRGQKMGKRWANEQMTVL